MKKRFNAFSLMEMMIVLLIISIVIAASAPMVNKKMMANMAEKTPWVWTNTSGSIAYNLNGSQDQKAIIGGTNVPNSINTRLHIASTETSGDEAKKEFIPQITLSDNNNNNNSNIAQISYNNASLAIGGNHNNDHKFPSTDGFDSLAMISGASTEGRYQIAIGYLASAVNKNLQQGYDIAIGHKATAGNKPVNGTTIGKNIAIGNEATANASESSIAIGYKAGQGSDGIGARSIAIGENASGCISDGKSRKQDFVAIGANVSANDGSVAIGGRKVNDDNVPVEVPTLASGKHSVAIGAGAQAIAQDSVAIGKGAQATQPNTIVLGTANDNVYIPGNLVVDKKFQVGNGPALRFFINDDFGNTTKMYIRHNKLIWNHTIPARNFMRDSDMNYTYDLYADKYDYHGGQDYNNFGGILISDRRLKNVGKPFEGGLADIKKLEVFNFTFKNDSDNTPHVGVMAQDLQKIFPSAVTKGKDGFLRIRFEDMFFAMVNSIQELSAKIDDIINKEIASLKTRLTDIEEQNRQIVEQFTAFDTKIKTVLDKNAEIETKIQKVADKNAELENQLKEQNAQLEKQNKELTEKNAQLEETVKECAEYKAQIEKRLADLEKKLAE